MQFLVGLTLCLPLLVCGCVRTIKAISFDRAIGGYLERAADANTVELAREELAKAVAEAKERGLTEGFTSVIYQTPDEDLGFWFKNLNESLSELTVLPASATPLERSNMLMKLRETLMRSGETETVNVPSGISVFPHNTFLAIVVLFSGVMALIGCCVMVAALDDL